MVDITKLKISDKELISLSKYLKERIMHLKAEANLLELSLIELNSAIRYTKVKK